MILLKTKKRQVNVHLVCYCLWSLCIVVLKCINKISTFSYKTVFLLQGRVDSKRYLEGELERGGEGEWGEGDGENHLSFSTQLIKRTETSVQV